MKIIRAIQIGDVVMLKSGGPRMTVTALDSPHSSGLLCEWFDRNGSIGQARFPVESLKRAGSSAIA